LAALGEDALNGIRVEVRPPTERGRLHVRRAAGARILMLESALDRPLAGHVDVDAALVFDYDEERLLINVEFLFPPRSWIAGLNQTWDDAAPAGDIAFTGEWLDHRGDAQRVQGRVNRDAGLLRIEIGARYADRRVKLSDDCLALLKGNELVGFLVRLG
jgi:hypothetical protein